MLKATASKIIIVILISLASLQTFAAPPAFSDAVSRPYGLRLKFRNSADNIVAHKIFKSLGSGSFAEIADVDSSLTDVLFSFIDPNQTTAQVVNYRLCAYYTNGTEACSPTLSLRALYNSGSVVVVDPNPTPQPLIKPVIDSLVTSSSGMKIRWINSNNSISEMNLQKLISGSNFSLLNKFNNISAVKGEIFEFNDINQTNGVAQSYKVCATHKDGREICSDVKSRTALHTTPLQETGCNSYQHQRVRRISNSTEFKTISANAAPGDLYLVSAGTYNLSEVVLSNMNGTVSSKITICGEGEVVLQGPGAQSKKRILTLKNSNNIIFANFTIKDAMKGLMVEGTNNSVFEKLKIYNIGHEGLHLLMFSSNNIVRQNKIYDTGRESGAEGIGEGIYVGSALTKGIDNSDNNKILNNTLGPGITAEHIDIKEYTKGGLIEGNTFDGTGMTGDNSSESWVNVKGNNYLVKNNKGNNSFKHGFKQIVRVVGWGDGNVFEGNEGSLGNTKSDRLLIYLHRQSSDAPNNIVNCLNNKIINDSASYLTNSSDCN